MHIWSRARGSISLQRGQPGVGPRPEWEFALNCCDEEFPPCSGRSSPGEGRSQLCVWYQPIIDGQVNVF
jgi:hypothetical protein